MIPEIFYILIFIYLQTFSQICILKITHNLMLLITMFNWNQNLQNSILIISEYSVATIDTLKNICPRQRNWPVK